MNEILKAIYEHGSNIIGYAVWSLMDNFELFSGFS
jgi:Beta-glucosidase/6-phospho-beta-glucosidase/beta-galactosidase